MKTNTPNQWLGRAALLRARSILAFSALILTATACQTTFQGPGELKIGTDPGSESTADAGEKRKPALSWNGEKLVEVEQSQQLKFDWPVDQARLTRGFLTNRRRSHWGLDLANKKGTPILASERGTVIYTGHAFRGYGKLIVIEHNDEWATLYSHLDKIQVKEGDTVEKGTQIGLMGRTGRATGVHLHFELRQHRQPINPLAYLPPFTGAGELAEQSRAAHARRVTSRERQEARP